jgi:hypothetical protein
MLTVGLVSGLVALAGGIAGLAFRIRSGRRAQRVEEAKAQAAIREAGKRGK